MALEDVPQSSVGAPMPIVLADEHATLVGFYLENRDPAWDGTSVRIIDPETTDEPVAVVEFVSCRAMTLGPPNDEAFDGHPLASRGLEPYGAFEVLDSSWIRGLERMNSVHPRHSADAFASLRHFILTFHDSTFECVAESYRISRHGGPLDRVVDAMRARLRA